MESASTSQNTSTQHPDNNSSTQQSQTTPLHQYTPTLQQPSQPFAASVPTTPIVSAGIFGLIVAGTGAMGSNLHKVESGDMTMGEAVSNSLVKGAAGGAAAAGATAAASTLTSGGVLGLAVALGTATGVSYLLTK